MDIVKKPKLEDYHEIPNSTQNNVNYNYKNYSIALLEYICYLEKQLKCTKNHTKSINLCKI